MKINASILVLGILALNAFGGSVSGTVSDCIWDPVPAKTGYGFPDAQTVYYFFAVPFQSGIHYEVSDDSLPTSSYFSVVAYANGLPNGGGKLADFEIQTPKNPYPRPGYAATMPFGPSTPYRVMIGDRVQQSPSNPNVITLNPSQFVYPTGAPRPAQIELAIRMYGPLPDGVKPPRLRMIQTATGQPLSCPQTARLYIDLVGLQNAGKGMPPARESGEELRFPWTAGSTLYPDYDGYLASAWESSGVALIAMPRPAFPECVLNDGNCVLDRTRRAAYTSLVVGDVLTKTQDTLSDRNFPSDSSGVSYIAFINDQTQTQNKLLVAKLRENGFNIYRSPDSGVGIVVHRQKFPAEINFPDSFRFVPQVEGCLAAAYITAAPVGTFCAGPKNPNDTSTHQCIDQAKGRLTALRARYDAIRPPPSDLEAGTCRCTVSNCP